MKDRIVIGRTGDKEYTTEYPLKTLKEAILNALVHRDYSTLTENTPIVINLFTDRLEIINKGGLYGNLTVETLGKVHAATRNPALTNMLAFLDLSEPRYLGIPTICEKMKKC